VKDNRPGVVTASHSSFKSYFPVPLGTNVACTLAIGASTSKASCKQWRRRVACCSDRASELFRVLQAAC
jgi:hypothetical protein